MKLRYRTVWISDTHLGSKGARAQDLACFLKQVRCDTLYLVGDIIDCWRLRSRWYWPDAHNDVLRRILKHASKGTKVIFVPGNHDDAVRQFIHLEFGGVKVLPHAEHTTIDGKKLFVTHGDQFDLVIQHSRALSMLGSVAYETLLKINRYYNFCRRKFGLPYASLSQAIKLKVKRACTFISRFEEILAEEASRRGMDGVVCGHIHKAEQREMPGGVMYLNCGDWVESCTALVEDDDGTLRLIDGIREVESLKQHKAEAASAGGKPLGSADLEDEAEHEPLSPDLVVLERALFSNYRPIFGSPTGPSQAGPSARGGD